MEQGWNKLDNAAKIFPSSIAKFKSQVFRISCDLTEDVDAHLLQKALHETLQVFTVFRSVLRRGWFWYYLEDSALLPKVREEYKYPCARLYDVSYRGLLFEVTYFRNRINLEVFHALTDGTGAMQFFKLLVIKYLSKKYGFAQPELDYDASRAQMQDDSFYKYYTNEKTPRQPRVKGCRIRMTRHAEDRTRVIGGSMPTRQVLDAAHQYGATVTAFLSACLMTAIAEELPARAKKRPVSLAVPVNLRNFFPSVSVRNFFNLVSIQHLFDRETVELEELCHILDGELKRQLTKENLLGQLNQFSKIEHNLFVKPVPLFFKDIVLKAAYFASGNETTATISNIGVVSMPEAAEPYIQKFGIFSSTDKIQACVCSFGGTLTVGFSSAFVSTDIERRFFRILTGLGITVEIACNFDDQAEGASQ